jgi:4,5-DOPA dioxygenase extradiol
MTFPSLFLSHGAPTLSLDDTPARAFLSGLGERLGQPRAILVASAHWDTERPRVTSTERNATIHDFYGFPRETFRLRYDAPGSPELAARVVDLLGAAGLGGETDNSRGLDHGAWVPLSLIYPQADIPVAQVSIQGARGPEHHLRLGCALAPLREKGVLIVGSGSLTHNLGAFFDRDANDPALDWVDAFADWTSDALLAGRVDDLVNYRRLAPRAVDNHPTDEHLLPLYVAMGAAGAEPRAERLHKSATYGALRMDVFAFGDPAADARPAKTRAA